MANDRPKVHSITSPKGTFVFPKLNEPDTKFNPAGDYSVKLKLSSAEAGPFMARLTSLHAAAVASANEKFKALKPEARKRLGQIGINNFYVEELGDDEQPTGNVIFNFKMKASGVTKAGKAWSRKPMIFDAKGHPLSPVPPI